MSVENLPRTELSVDTVFELLADERCRYVLYHLRDTGGEETSYEEVIDHITADESDAGEGKVPYYYREHVAMALHHTCLPKLAAAGIIDYDTQTKAIRYHGGPRIEDCLDWAAALELGGGE